MIKAARAIRGWWTWKTRGYKVVDGVTISRAVFDDGKEVVIRMGPAPDFLKMEEDEDDMQFHAGPVTEDGDVWAWDLIENPDLWEDWKNYDDYVPAAVYVN